MKTKVQSTSRSAYQELNLGPRQLAVYNLLKQGAMCNLEIANKLGLPVNQITGRTNELVSRGLVEEKFKAPNTFTGKRVIYWGIITDDPQLTMF